MDDLRIEPINKDHMQYIRHWWKYHQLPPEIEQTISSTGFMCYKGNDEACACWLYVTNSQLAFADNMVINPLLDRKERHEAIEHMIEHLALSAEALGCVGIIANVQGSRLQQRAADHGFKVMPTQSMARPLNGWIKRRDGRKES